MKVDGTYILKAPLERVWELLNDPSVLQRCIPGCEKLEATGEDSFDTVLNVGMGAISGIYNGKVKIAEKQPPHAYKMVVEGKGKPGSVKGSGTIQLSTQDGATTIAYNGDVQVVGTIASVGQRMLQGATKTMVGQFFTAIEIEVAAAEKTAAAQRAAMEKGEDLPLRPFEPPRHHPLLIFLRYIWNIIKRWLRGK